MAIQYRQLFRVNRGNNINTKGVEYLRFGHQMHGFKLISMRFFWFWTVKGWNEPQNLLPRKALGKAVCIEASSVDGWTGIIANEKGLPTKCCSVSLVRLEIIGTQAIPFKATYRI